VAAFLFLAYNTAMEKGEARLKFYVPEHLRTDNVVRLPTDFSRNPLSLLNEIRDQLDTIGTHIADAEINPDIVGETLILVKNGLQKALSAFEDAEETA
jgi:hypothetical protein